MVRSTLLWVGAACGATGLAGCSSGGSVEVGERYQVATWATPAVANSAGTVAEARHGAYRIDTKTGEVWSIDDQNHVNALPPP